MYGGGRFFNFSVFRNLIHAHMQFCVKNHLSTTNKVGDIGASKYSERRHVSRKKRKKMTKTQIDCPPRGEQ